ncbi:MAG TPA: sugar phosphate isomerase/epimerase [Verrucomicrobiae bacterium]|nr:sugar phosphate isomerase/epimerase [Verrucomicrobiae bacterium]
MKNTSSNLSRRKFLKTAGVITVGLGVRGPALSQDAASAGRRVKLGIDNFAVRAMGWKAPQLIDYAAQLKTDAIFITDLGPFEKRDDDSLKDLRKAAADKGLQIWLGSWSICPTSKSFKKDWGTAEEHLALGIRMAKALGSPAFRVVLGNGEDRKTEGGIEARIADTVKVLKSQRSRAIDAGVKIAIENHAGDLQAWELVNLIEEAGKDFVGANMDSGNATWTMEDPLASLETLGPYAVTTSLRDSAIWESTNGATVQWTAMGEGNAVDWKVYFDRFAKLCPGVPVFIETISGFNREIPYLKPEFWSVWPKARAADFARFVALARKGKPRDAWKAPEGKDRRTAEQEYQKGEVERSIAFCKQLGLGIKT